MVPKEIVKENGVSLEEDFDEDQPTLGLLKQTSLNSLNYTERKEIPLHMKKDKELVQRSRSNLNIYNKTNVDRKITSNGLASR